MGGRLSRAHLRLTPDPDLESHQVSPSHTLTANDLDRDELRRLASIEHDAGVLTIVVGHDPSRPDEGRTAELAVRSGLRKALQACEGDLRERLEDRIEEVHREIDALVDPTSFGRGRLLVTTLEPGAPIDVVRVQSPMEHEVVVARHSFIRPLARVWSAGRPIRVMLVGQDGVRVMDWSMGQLEEKWTREVSFGDAQLADVKKGPGGTTHMRGSVNREAFDSRLDANRSRVLRGAVREAIDEAAERGVDRALVIGPAKVRDLLTGELDGAPLTTWTDDRDLWNADDDDVLAVVERHATEGHVRESEALLHAILDTEAAGGPATIGLAGVISALNQGRVDTLVVSTGTDVRGFVTEDGLLAVNPGPDHVNEPEPHLVDRTVASTLATDGRVVPIPDEQAARLGEDGVGALLRW